MYAVVLGQYYIITEVNMLHDKVYKRFKQYFPLASKTIIQWFPNGKNSIRIRRMDGQEFVFTYYEKHNYRLETVDSFIKRLQRKEGV